MQDDVQPVARESAQKVVLTPQQKQVVSALGALFVPSKPGDPGLMLGWVLRKT